MQVVRIAVVTLATVTLLAAGGGDRAAGSHSLAAVEPAVRHPYAVVVDPVKAPYGEASTSSAHITASGRITRVAVRGGLDRPHGVVFDRAGDILVAEDSRRVRRIEPATGRAKLVVDGVDTNRIAVGRDGTLFLAGGSPIGGSLRRLEPGGEKPRILFEGSHVSDVAVLPDGDLIVTAVEPGAIFRVDPRTGARRKLAG